MPRKARSHRGTTSRRPTTISIRTRSTSGFGKKFLTASVPTRKRFGSLTMSLKTVVASSARNWATKAAPPVRRTRPCMSSRRPRAPSIAKSTATPAIPSKTSISGRSPNIPNSWASNINTLQQYAVEHSRLHIPIIYGYDAVHGNNNVLGAEIFPHGIGMGATADATLVGNSEAATARGANAMGVRWTFAPVLEVSRDARYGRYYESFGEDPILD